jgi:hypothetical protein
MARCHVGLEKFKNTYEVLEDGGIQDGDHDLPKPWRSSCSQRSLRLKTSFEKNYRMTPFFTSKEQA